jgi:cell fate (sporulation/competence/biofilm development) regulator YlbF (YheA/YmcA/DUF963 family)
MDLIAMAREIGKGIQQDERYKKATGDAAAVNASAEIKEKISAFEDLRVQLEAAMAQSVPGQQDSEVMDLDEKMHALYDEINAHPLMMTYNESRHEFEELINFLTHIITGSANGENPDEIQMESCTGSCSTCGGCH